MVIANAKRFLKQAWAMVKKPGMPQVGMPDSFLTRNRKKMNITTAALAT